MCASSRLLPSRIVMMDRVALGAAVRLVRGYGVVQLRPAPAVGRAALGPERAHEVE